jgi:hypothetical protein
VELKCVARGAEEEAARVAKIAARKMEGLGGGGGFRDVKQPPKQV